MANRSISEPVRPLAQATLGDLFLGFLAIGMTSIGGGLTGWIRRELVERRHWIDDRQFLTNYALSQMVPGAVNVNLAVLVGTQLRGAAGALAALAGLMLVPLIILMTIGTFYFAAHEAPGGWWLKALLAGAGAAAIGYNIATGIRLARRNVRSIHSALVAAAIVIGIGVLRVPLIEVLAVVMPCSLLLTVLAERR